MNKFFWKDNTGAVELNTVLILFFIVAVISGGVLYASSGMTFYKTNSRNFELRTAADTLLDNIIKEIQPLKTFQYDDKENELIKELCDKYSEYKLKIMDVSSGYNLNFLSDADMADANLARFLFRDKTGFTFTVWRNANGLNFDKELWRELINDEAWESCVSYGWLHKKDVGSFAFRSISASFSENDPNKLFPLINNFPRINVNMINPDMLYPLITRSSFKLEKAQEKADTLVSKLQNGPVLHADISAILEIPVNHSLMEYFGTKTSFWRLQFVMGKALEVEAIVAAFPKKDGAVQEIESYRLVSRSFIGD